MTERQVYFFPCNNLVSRLHDTFYLSNFPFSFFLFIYLFLMLIGRFSLAVKEICLLFVKQSGPQDQKSVIFSHSLISLNQLLQNSKNTVYIFLTFRNHIKIFVSQNILHKVLNVVFRKTLNIRTDRTDKTVKTLIRLLLEEQSDQGLHCCHPICFINTSYCKENPNCSILGYFRYLFLVFQFLEVFT